jgi:hypothetical protein
MITVPSSSFPYPIMNQAFWMGVFPGIQEEQMKYVRFVLKEFFANYC